MRSDTLANIGLVQCFWRHKVKARFLCGKNERLLRRVRKLLHLAVTPVSKKVAKV